MKDICATVLNMSGAASRVLTLKNVCKDKETLPWVIELLVTAKHSKYHESHEPKDINDASRFTSIFFCY